MASSAPGASVSIGYPVTEKLAKNNFPLWRAEVMTALRGAQVAHLISADALVLAKEIARSADKPIEMIPNPEYDNWVAKDQQVLNYMLSSISREILVSRVHRVHGGRSEGHPGHVHVTVPWPHNQH
jgi:hypothetical protein